VPNQRLKKQVLLDEEIIINRKTLKAYVDDYKSIKFVRQELENLMESVLKIQHQKMIEIMNETFLKITLQPVEIIEEKS
jgi:hypothetical protein